MIRVLSYGAGVDSTALLQLAIEGEVPKPDVAVFADTQAESTSTLATVKRMEDAAEKAGIPFRRISAGSLMDWRENGTLHTPLHFRHNATTAARVNAKRGHGKDRVSVGDAGMLRRTCTSRFKIQPVRYFTRDSGATRHEPAKMMLGITLDEAAARMGDSLVQYVKHDYPLVDLGLTGASCEAILAERGIEAHKSACTMCPLTNAGRRNSAMTNVDDRDMAVAYDRDIRNALPDHPELFVDRDTMAPLKSDPPEKPFTLFSQCPSDWC